MELISNNLFPIAMSVALFWKINDQDKQHNQQLETQAKQHKEEMDAMSDALNNNTIAITRLVDHFEK